MKKYEVVLFDADDTLYDFSKIEENALETVFKDYGLSFKSDILLKYREISEELWFGYHNGEVSKEELQTLRFTRLFEIIGVNLDEAEFNRKYLTSLGKGDSLITDAYEICEEIVAKGKKIYIVSNGVLYTQELRSKYSKLKDFVSGFFVSEIVGYKKPNVRFFQYVLENIGPVEKENILVIGDSLSTDILGGNNVGIDTCWFNSSGNSNDSNIIPTYEIKELKELKQFFI